MVRSNLRGLSAVFLIKVGFLSLLIMSLFYCRAAALKRSRGLTPTAVLLFFARDSLKDELFFFIYISPHSSVVHQMNDFREEEEIKTGQYAVAAFKELENKMKIFLFVLRNIPFFFFFLPHSQI